MLEVVPVERRAMDADASRQDRRITDEQEIVTSPEQQSQSASEPLDPARVSLIHIIYTANI